MLTEFFFYAFSKISSWKSLSELQATTLDDITDLFLQSTYKFIDKALNTLAGIQDKDLSECLNSKATA